MKIARFSILAVVTGALAVATAYAAPVESVESALAKPALQKVDAFLGAQAVAQQLTKLGVTPERVQARLAKLEDAQLTALAAHVDKLQAGGDIESGYPHPLGPFGCVLKRIGDTIAHIFKVLFCWTDVPFPN